MSSTPENVREVVLYAWVGEDEFGDGTVGIKQGSVPAGIIPLVSVSREKMSQDYIKEGLQSQADAYHKTIRLCKFVFVEEVTTLEPGLAEEDELTQQWRARAQAAASRPDTYAEAMYWSKLIEAYQQSMRRLNESVSQDKPEWATEAKKIRDYLVGEAEKLEAHFSRECGE